jgi:high mobility group protein B1
MWRNLPAKKKVKYEEMAQMDRKRYERELEASGNRTGKVPKDPNAPKKPTSSYMYFNREMAPVLREQNSSITVRTLASVWRPHPRKASISRVLQVPQLGALVGALWRDLIPQTKARYAALAARDRERYEKDMSAYTSPSWS